MDEFYALEYFNEVYAYVEENLEVTEWHDFVSEYLREADDTKPYCVAEISCPGVSIRDDVVVFTQAAFLLNCYYEYKENGFEWLVESFVSNSDAESYEELMEECEQAGFTFEEYLREGIRYDEGFFFIVKDDYTVQNKEDEKDLNKCIKKYKDKTEIQYNLKTVSAELYGKDGTDWIFKG